MVYEIAIAGAIYRVELEEKGDLLAAGGKTQSAFACKVNGQPVRVDANFPQPGILSLLLENRSYEIRTALEEGTNVLTLGHAGDIRRIAYQLNDPRTLRGRRSATAGLEGPKKITAPMPGKVVRILAPAGSSVEQGDGVIVIEAMKMQNELKAPKSGKVTRVISGEGTTVNPGETLAIIE